MAFPKLLDIQQGPQEKQAPLTTYKVTNDHDLKSLQIKDPKVNPISLSQMNNYGQAQH
jgi:hypothetical protein